MAGSHPHDHHGERQQALFWALGLTLFMALVEFVGGFWAHSLSLIADAGHMAADAGALGLSLIAYWAARRPPDTRRTYGYARSEVLAALANGAVLWVTVGIILREAVGRIGAPVEVHGKGMFVIAGIGLLTNGACLFLLQRLQSSDLNIRAALLHVASDALGSVGTMIAAGIVMATGWTAADPIMSMLICAAVGWSSWGLVSDSVHILMDGTPSHLEVEAVRSALLGIGSVTEVHDLHLWSISSGRDSMTGHLVVRSGADAQTALREASELLRTKFNIDHVTLQIEFPEQTLSPKRSL